MVKTRVDLSGKKFGRLFVIEQDEDAISPKGFRSAKWICRCDCGNVCSIRGTDLVNNHTRSCGCLHKEITSDISRKKNQWRFPGDGTAIGTDSNGIDFVIDDDDFQRVKDYCWFVGTHGYVIAHTPMSGRNIKIHRLIMGLDGGDSKNPVDHINHSKTDNRKCNLRVVTTSQNLMNSKTPTNNTSGVKGVGFDKRYNKWRAQIVVNGKQISLGYFLSKEDAINARKNAEIKYYGEFRYECP